MSTLKTDLTTGDLVVTNNRLTFVDGAVQVAQSLASRLRTFQGEWFLDLRFGTPLLQQVLVKNPVNAEAALKSVINSTEGVISLLSFSLDIDRATRKGTVSFKVLTENGELPGQVEIPISGG